MKFKTYNNLNFKQSIYYQRLPSKEQEVFDILSSVFHFKANNYVLDHLIRWKDVPNDPIYKLVFPRKEMLHPEDYEQLEMLNQAGLPKEVFTLFVNALRKKMNPQLQSSEFSHPTHEGERLYGVTQNFDTIISLYPSPMVKTCHSYCTYCFRWIMFNNKEVQDYSSYTEPSLPVDYIKSLPKVSDVLFTGADPLVLKADMIQKFIDPILEIDSVKVIRIGTKSLAWWPFRFTTDKDADALLKLFEYIISKGKHLNICAHFTHARELENKAVQEAIHRIQSTGAIIRCQGPLVKDINDSAKAISDLWTKQIELGLVPYYLFVEANHNSESCFRIPMARALEIFQTAQKQTSGLARTVRGPVFMNDHHRILIDGVIEINNEKFFALKSLQAPPNTRGEGEIKLIPFDEQSIDFGDLVKLFSSEASLMVTE